MERETVPADARVVLCVADVWSWYTRQRLYKLFEPYQVELCLATPSTDPSTVPWLRLRLILAFGPAGHNWLKSRLALAPFAEYLRLPPTTKIFGTSFLSTNDEHKGATDTVLQMADRLFPPAVELLHECPLEDLVQIDLDLQDVQALRLREDLVIPANGDANARVAFDRDDLLNLKTMLQVWQPVLVGVYDAAGLLIWQEENNGRVDEQCAGADQGCGALPAGTGAIQADLGGSESELSDRWEDDEGVGDVFQD